LNLPEATPNSGVMQRLRADLVPILAILAVKLLILGLDHAPRFFLWDSVTYLQGAVGEGLPRDRSFLYSLLIRAITVPVHSLQPLVWAQTLAGVGAAYCIYLMLRTFFLVPRWWALAGALLVAVEPSQVLYERMVMAEAFGGMLWLAFVLLVLAYMREPRVSTLLAVAVAGILTIAFRLNGTAAIILIGGLLPLWRYWFIPSSRVDVAKRVARRRLLAHLGIALIATATLHVGYRDLVGSVAHAPPGYIGTEGLFLLGYVAPVIEDKDFADTGCQSGVLQDVARPLGDPRNRNYQLWGPDGLWDVMKRDCPQPEAAAATVAHAASHRVLPSVVPMALSITAQYFDDAEAHWRLESDLGRKGLLPKELIAIGKNNFDLDVAPITFSDTLSSVWFVHCRWWLTGCFLLAPLLAALLIVVTRRHEAEPQARILGLLLLSMFCIQFLLSPVMEFRYLHPFPPLMIVCAIAILAAWKKRERN
jgi:hypothetical protein